MSAAVQATLFDWAREQFEDEPTAPAITRKPRVKQPSDYTPKGPAADDPERVAFVRTAMRLAERKGLYGVTVGEVIYDLEQHQGIRFGGKKMEDKQKEQRQTSWTPTAMKHDAGLAPTDRTRPSPVRRQHKHRQTVYVLPDFLLADTPPGGAGE